MTLSRSPGIAVIRPGSVVWSIFGTRGHEQTRKICNRPIVLSDQKVVFASDVAGVHLLSVAAGGVESIPTGLSTPASSAPPPPPRILVALDLIALATSSGVASGYFSR